MTLARGFATTSARDRDGGASHHITARSIARGESGEHDARDEGVDESLHGEWARGATQRATRRRGCSLANAIDRMR